MRQSIAPSRACSAVGYPARMTRRLVTAWASLACLLAGCGAESADPPTTVTSGERAAEPEPAQAETEPPPEPAVVPVAAKCAAIEEAAAETLAIDPLLEFVVPADAVSAREIWRALSEPLGECHDAGRGAWVAVPLAVRLLTGGRTPAAAGPDAPGHLFELDYALTYVDPDGREHRAATTTLRHETTDNVPEGQELAFYPPQDLDGDGVGELASVVVSFGPDFSATEDLILQFRDDAIVPFDDFGEMNLTDYDRDGRFDVLVQRPWRCTFYNDMDGTTIEAGCPWVLLHGVDGGVSGDDAVAKAYLREQCGRRPTELVPADPPHDGCWPERGIDHRNIGCARIWGASVAEVQAQVRREYGRLRRECRSSEQLQSLLAHAEHEPPLTLE